MKNKTKKSGASQREKTMKKALGDYLSKKGINRAFIKNNVIVLCSV